MRPMKKIQDWGVCYVDWVTNGRGVIQVLIEMLFQNIGK